jgi:hypothetical protein
MSFKSYLPDGWASFSAGGFNAAVFYTDIVHTTVEGTNSAYAFGFVLKSAS